MKAVDRAIGFCQCNFGVKVIWDHERQEKKDQTDGHGISNLTKLLYASGEDRSGRVLRHACGTTHAPGASIPCPLLKRD